MGPMKLYFDFRDIFRAPRLALSGKKIWIFVLANIVGFIQYWILTVASLLFAGNTLNETWSTHGLFPSACGIGPWYTQIFYYIGIFIWIFAIYLACTAVARITYKQLKGDEFFSSGDAWNYVKKHWHPVLFSAVSIILIVVFFLVMAVIMALFGKIPYVGEVLFFSPLYLIYFFGALFTIYTSLVLITALIYTPAIVAAYEEDTMGTVFQSYSLTWSQPWRILVYSAILLPLTAISVLIFKHFWVWTYKFINLVFGSEWLMGAKLGRIMDLATRTITPETGSVKSWGAYGQYQCSFQDLFPFQSLGATTGLSGTEIFAAFLVGIVLFILTVSVFSYGFSILSVGYTIMFVIFKKKSDDDNLLERKDEDELEEESEEEDELDLEDESEEGEPKEDEADEGVGSGKDDVSDTSDGSEDEDNKDAQ